jgi:hypothetical protein
MKGKMKGFALTPIVFLALVLIALSFSLHMSKMDKTVAQSIAKEGSLRKLMNEIDKNLTAMSGIVFEAIYQNNDNTKTLADMQSRIMTEINRRTNINVNLVVLTPAKKNNTAVSITINRYSISSPGGSVNLSGSTYNFTVGHPFAHFANMYTDADVGIRLRLCDYKSGCEPILNRTGHIIRCTSCSFNSSAFGSALNASYNFQLRVFGACSLCELRYSSCKAQITANMEVSDQSQYLTQDLRYLFRGSWDKQCV